MNESESESSAGSVTQAARRWQKGHDSAAAKLEQRFHNYLLALVRRRRSRKFRPRIDSEGVVNAALKSFLSGVPKDEFPVLENRQDIQRVLCHLVVTTLLGEIRTNSRAKRAVSREVPLEWSTKLAVQDCDLENLLENLIDELRQTHEMAIRIIELTLEGLTNNEIGDEVGLSLRSVQQIKKRIRARILANDGNEA